MATQPAPSEAGALGEQWGREQWTRQPWQEAADGNGADHDLLVRGVVTQEVHTPARNPHSRVDQDLLDAMHRSHEAPRRPWLLPLLVFGLVLVGAAIWLWIAVLAPPELESGEVAFGHGAYAVAGADLEAVESDGSALLDAVPTDLADGDVYELEGSDTQLLLGMHSVGNSSHQLEFTRIQDEIGRVAGTVQGLAEADTSLGPGTRVEWTDATGVRHVTYLTVHEERLIVIQTSSATGDPGPPIDPVLVSMRATGRQPIATPELGTSFWIAIGLMVLGVLALGFVFRSRGRSVLGGAFLGGAAGLAVGVLLAVLT